MWSVLTMIVRAIYCMFMQESHEMHTVYCALFPQFFTHHQQDVRDTETNSHNKAAHPLGWLWLDCAATQCITGPEFHPISPISSVWYIRQWNEQNWRTWLTALTQSVSSSNAAGAADKTSAKKVTLKVFISILLLCLLLCCFCSKRSNCCLLIPTKMESGERRGGDFTVEWIFHTHCV